MEIKYDNFAIRGFDISGYNGNIDWSKIKGKCDYIAIRVGYGNTVDWKFKANWESARENGILRIPYWYMDYYSNWMNPSSAAYGMSDEEWGRKQAENCWNQIKNDNDKTIVFLDVESSGASYSKPLSDPESKKHAQKIGQAFLQRMDELNGMFNGVYASVGWLSWFYNFYRNRPLWVAWYTRLVQPEDVLYACTRNGWLGEVLMWQYASDGDLDNNGTPDGINMLGTQLKEMDLNAWVASEERFAKFASVVYEPGDPDVVEDPDSDVGVDSSTYLVTASVLNIRDCPSMYSDSYGTLLNGKPLLFDNKVFEGPGSKKGWLKLHGQDVYMSLDWLQKIKKE